MQAITVLHIGPLASEPAEFPGTLGGWVCTGFQALRRRSSIIQGSVKNDPKTQYLFVIAAIVARYPKA